MSDQWYYGRGEERLGPVSTEELRHLITSDRLCANDLVCREGLNELTPAGDVEGLFLPPPIPSRFASTSLPSPETHRTPPVSSPGPQADRLQTEAIHPESPQQPPPDPALTPLSIPKSVAITMTVLAFLPFIISIVGVSGAAHDAGLVYAGRYAMALWLTFLQNGIAIFACVATLRRTPLASRDATTLDTIRERPQKVGTAVILLYIALGISFLVIVRTLQVMVILQTASLVTAAPVFSGPLVIWFFIYMIGKGYNWARITLLVLFVIGIVVFIPTLLMQLAKNPLVGLLNLGQTTIQSTALLLLFQNPASKWFREKRSFSSVVQPSLQEPMPVSYTAGAGGSCDEPLPILPKCAKQSTLSPRMKIIGIAALCIGALIVLASFYFIPTMLYPRMAYDFAEAQNYLLGHGDVDAFLRNVNESRLVEWEAAAEKGIPEAEWLYGNVLLRGVGCQKAPEEAVKCFRKAADQGNAAAQTFLGNCYREGQGVSKNDAEAVKWYRKAADQGFPVAQLCMAWCYHDGYGVSKDDVEGLKCIRKAAEGGYSVAQEKMGDFYAAGVLVPRNDAEAVKWYRKAAEQGNPNAQYAMGYCYQNGQGVSKNGVEAVKWYRKAAEQEDSSAYYSLGECYRNGLGVVKDDVEAVTWYRKAAECGNRLGQSELGECYQKGLGISKDDAEAVKWYRKAAEQGWGIAQCAMGDCYHEGIGVVKNDAEAARWYRMAAKQGYIQAQTKLAECRENGLSVSKDENAADRNVSKDEERATQNEQPPFDSVLEVRVLKIHQASVYTCMDVEIRNTSNRFVSAISIGASLYGKNHDYLGCSSGFSSNLRPGKTTIQTIYFHEIQASGVVSWELSIQMIGDDKGLNVVEDNPWSLKEVR